MTVRAGEPTFFDGTLTLRDRRGTVTLRFGGIHIGAVGQVTTSYLGYTITGGTGAFRGATGSGRVTYTTMPSPLANPVAGEMLFRLTFGTPKAARA